jgi:hypothetical protein
MEVWISSPVRSRKPVCDEHHPVGGGQDGGLQVQRGAPLLVHDADLEGGLRQAENVLDTG